jgi:hypothetical protein
VVGRGTRTTLGLVRIFRPTWFLNRVKQGLEVVIRATSRMTERHCRLLQSGWFHSARIDDARIKRGQGVQGSFLDALQEICNNQQKIS